jgi:hypothetical protein
MTPYIEHRHVLHDENGEYDPYHNIKVANQSRHNDEDAKLARSKMLL